MSGRTGRRGSDAHRPDKGRPATSRNESLRYARVVGAGNGEPFDADQEFAAYDNATARGRRSEPALTKAIGYALRADAAAAGSFARTLVCSLEPLRDRPPARLKATPEAPFMAGLVGQRNRLADLFLWSAEERYGLLIEAKLGASCSWKQIPDYLKLRARDLTGLPADAKLEVAVLASRSLALPASRQRAQWLGCATWVEILDELEEIQFSDADRADRWCRLLKHYRHDRGFGTTRGVNLPPANTLDSGVLVIVRAARTASKGTLRVRAVPWLTRPSSQTVVRKRPSGASMCLELQARPGRRTFVEIDLDHPADGGRALARIVRWRGKRNDELNRFAVPKNAQRCREEIAAQVGRLVLEQQLP